MSNVIHSPPYNPLILAPDVLVSLRPEWISQCWSHTIPPYSYQEIAIFDPPIALNAQSAIVIPPLTTSELNSPQTTSTPPSPGHTTMFSPKTATQPLNPDPKSTDTSNPSQGNQRNEIGNTGSGQSPGNPDSGSEQSSGGPNTGNEESSGNLSAGSDSGIDGNLNPSQDNEAGIDTILGPGGGVGSSVISNPDNDILPGQIFGQNFQGDSGHASNSGSDKNHGNGVIAIDGTTFTPGATATIAGGIRVSAASDGSSLVLIEGDNAPITVPVPHITGTSHDILSATIESGRVLLIQSNGEKNVTTSTLKIPGLSGPQAGQGEVGKDTNGLEIGNGAQGGEGGASQDQGISKTLKATILASIGTVGLATSVLLVYLIIKKKGQNRERATSVSYKR